MPVERETKMDDNTDRYYRHSGRVPTMGTVWMLIGGGVVASVISFLYALLDYYNPLVYFTFIGTIVFGLTTGGAVMWGGILGKVRNNQFSFIVGIVLGLFAIYMAWVWFIWLLVEEIIFEPGALFQAMQFVGEVGVWSIRNWQPTGWALYCFWLVEAGVIMCSTVMVSAGNDDPFCEDCNEWTEEQEGVALLQVTDNAMLKAALEQERYEVLSQVPVAPADSTDCLHVNTHTCSKCSESHYLTIEQVTVTIDEKGNDDTDKTDVLKNLWVPAEVVENLLSAKAEAAEAAESEQAEPAADAEDTETSEEAD